MDEKITSEAKVRVWTDHIPLQWKYTAGVAGDRFLRLLMQGKIQASECKNCKKSYLPPKIFCKDCFSQLNDWKDIDENTGSIYSFTTLPNKKDGGKEETIVLIRFDGIEGGLIGRMKSSKEEKPRIGMKVRPVFKPKNSRIGDLSDIDYFEKLPDSSKQS
jgi:uncharacterized protein